MLLLDSASAVLCDDKGRRFDPAARRWRSSRSQPRGTAVTPQEAVGWLQRDSGQPCRVPIGVIGPRSATAKQLKTAESGGAALAGLGLTVLCGGREGVMEATCRGVASAAGLSIGLLPDEDWASANPFVSVPLASGIGVARNAIIARASLCLVAIGGGVGTLSEIAFALQFGRPVLAIDGAPAVPGVLRYRGWRELEKALCRIVLGLTPGPEGLSASAGAPTRARPAARPTQRGTAGYGARARRKTSR